MMKKLTNIALTIICIFTISAASLSYADGAISFGVGGGGYGYPYYGGYGYGYPWGGYGYGPGWGYGGYGPGIGVGFTVPIGGDDNKQPQQQIFQNRTNETVTVNSASGSVTIDPGGSRAMRKPKSKRGRGCNFSVQGQDGQIADFGSCNDNITIIKSGTNLDIR